MRSASWVAVSVAVSAVLNAWMSACTHGPRTGAGQGAGPDAAAGMMLLDVLGREAIWIVSMLCLLPLAAAHRRRRRAVADALHRLRNTLASVDAQAQCAVHGAADARGVDPAVLRALRDSVRRVSVLADALFRTMLSAPGTPPRMPLSLARVAADVLRERAPLAERRGIALAFEPGTDECWIAGDPFALAELIECLLDNALRYTPRGGTVVLALVQASTAVGLSVCDSGPGIAPRHYARVLRRGTRLEQGEGAAQDAGKPLEQAGGIGLHRVRTICAAHGARLALGRSRLGGLAAQVTFARCAREGAPMKDQ